MNYRVKLFIGTICFLIITLNKCYSQNDSILYWKPDILLNWTDFQCVNQDTSRLRNTLETAYSSLGLEYFCETSDKIPKFTIDNFFNRKKSWSNTESDFILSHEQLHFDIDQLFVRKIRAKILNYQNKKITNPDSYYEAIRNLIAQSEAAQLKYDTETAHGLINEMQIEWRNRITRELNSLQNQTNKN